MFLLRLSTVALIFLVSLLPGYCQRHATLPAGAPGAGYAAPRLTAWRILGPGGGGAQYNPAVSPHDSNLVFVSSDMTGCYISENGGDSWREFNLRFWCRFAFDPTDDKVIYAATHVAGLYRSEDRGRTWNLIYPDPAVMDRVVMTEDEGEPMLLAKTGNRYPAGASTVAVDPEDGNVIYATSSSNLIRSSNRGKSWETLAEMSGAGGRMLWIDPASPKGNRSVYVLLGYTIGAYENGKFRLMPAPAGTSWIYDMSAGSPPGGGKPVFYVIADYANGEKDGGLIISRDGGGTWQQAHTSFLEMRPPGAPTPEVRSVGCQANNPDVVYISYSELLVAGAGEKPYLGVAKSTDAGRNWQLVWKDTDVPSPNVSDAYLNERYGTDWGENPHNIFVHPRNPDLVFTTDLGRTMRTTDGGATWKAVYSVRLEDGTFTTTGIDVTTSYGVHFDPFDPKRIFISYTDIGLFRSENGGQSWIDSWKGSPYSWRNTTYAVEFDPAVQGRMWAAMSGIHDLPRMRMLNKLAPDDKWPGGILTSTDGGRNWSPTVEGMDQAPMTHVLLDPASPIEARVLYATAFATGVYKSTDGGKSWQLKNQGITGRRPLAWRLHRDALGTLYLVVVRRAPDAAAGSEEEGAIYRSRDGAETWERLTLPAGLNGPTGIVTDPRDPNRIYLNAFGRYKIYSGSPGEYGGIWVSTDGGQQWRNTHKLDQHVYDVTLDPRNPDLLYCTGYEARAWRSVDRGETWTRIPGFNFKHGHRIIPDPYNPDMVYITTYGSSVWYGPAAGSGGSEDEDLVTPEIAFGELGIVTVSPTALQAPVAGGNLPLTVTACPSCTWTVSGLPAWITLSGAGSGTGSATVTLVVAPNPGAPRAAQFSVAGIAVSISQSSSVLLLTPAGVVNGASYTAPVAPGSIAAIFGNFLMSAPLTASSFPLPFSLGGVSFLTGSTASVPLFYVYPEQAGGQIPWELSGLSQVSVTVSRTGQTSAAQTVSLATYAPGLFATNGQGTGQGSILGDNFLLAGAANPATAGSTIVQIYCTGLGPVSNRPATGAVAPVAPLAETTVKPSVTIGGAQAEVLFSGLAPGYVGLYQVNARVPQGSVKGGAVPVVLSIGGAVSNTVTIAVR